MKRIILCLVTLVLIFGMILSIPNELLAAKPASPTAETWSATGNMTIGRWGQTASLLHDGSVLLVGCYHFGEQLSSAELYNPKTATWSST